MEKNKIDSINTFLILLSFGLAYLLPFQLFLFSYAILGPLHYFTEINWIRDKNYFVKNKAWVYSIVCFAFVVTTPYLLRLPIFDTFSKNTIVQNFKINFPSYFDSLFLITIITALSLISFTNKKHRSITISLGILLAILLHSFSLYHLIIGGLLPTLIHVYLFTILFMWYGNLKTKSNLGKLNVVLMGMVPIMIIFLTLDQNFYHFPDSIKQTYLGNNFHLLNVSISKILGLSNGTEFFFYEVIDLKIQMFIAFSYTYHYLNWFSKTTIIGWHKKLTTRRSILIVSLWLGAIGLYFYDYKIGLALLLFSSFLHVFMEFPLNIISIRGILFSFLRPRKK